MPIKVYDTTVTQIFELTLLKNQTFQHPRFSFPNSSVVRIPSTNVERQKSWALACRMFQDRPISSEGLAKVHAFLPNPQRKSSQHLVIRKRYY